MKNLNFKVAVIALGLFLGMSTGAKAQETEHEREAREAGVPTSSQVVEQSLAKAYAEKAANDARVQEQRNAEAQKPRETPPPTPKPNSSGKASQQ